MRACFISFAVLFAVVQTASAQDWTKSLIKELGKSGAEQKAKLDSSDFQFSMSVNENASFFDVKQKGEGLANGLYSMKEKSERTSVEVARDTLDHALSYYQLRMYKMAEWSFANAKDYMEKNSLTNTLSYLKCMSDLGLVCLVQGRLTEADQYITYALNESEKLLGKNSAAYTANLNSRAKLYHLMGKYNEAEKEFGATAGYAKQVFTEKSKQYAVVLNNQAMLYQSIGRYDQGVALMKQAIEASQAAPNKGSKKSFDQREFQSNLALMYQLSGDFADAEATFLAIKKVFDNRMQTNNPEYASMLNQLALLYLQMGKMDQVEPLLTKAAGIYKKKFTEENPSFAKTQNDLGNLYRIQGKFPEAEKSLQKAKGIRQRTLGDSHPDYVKSVEDLAIVYWKKGDLTAAAKFYGEAMNKSLNFISNYFPPMSEAEKTKYWDVLQPRFQRFFNFAIEASAQDPALVRDLFDYQIATKALLLSSTNKIKKTILASKDATLIKDYNDWIGQKEALSRYYALSKEELDQQKIDLKALESNANALEKSLSQRSGDFSQGYSSDRISYQKVGSMLADGEAVVEIIRVQGFDKALTAESRYVALVMTKNSEPKILVLPNGGQLETRYAKFYKNAILTKGEDGYSYDQFWGWLEGALTGKKTIYFSPDGVFNQINIATLKKPAGDFLINKHDFVILGNSKDLVAIKARKPVVGKKNAFLLGFPDYGGNSVAALPGTKVEIDGVSKVLKLAGYQVSQFVQKEASEKNLKAVKGPTLMHIATHGYFLADAEGKSDAAGIDAENAKNNPLLRSGLLLASASATLAGTSSPDLESNDNGVLTAYEAMNLNLEGTDLIVMSACETGLGDVRAGEGVYGLQRAFQVAGANALVMSLWKVDDAATQLLMTNFYNNLVKGNSKLKAFKQAQIQLMTRYKEPYYWGAFVMMGQ